MKKIQIKKYKFAFLHRENLTWFLANKRPKDIYVKTSYFGIGEYYQYRIRSLLYNYVDDRKEHFTEHEFLVGMIKKAKDDVKKYAAQCKKYADVKIYGPMTHQLSALEHARQQVRYFTKRKKEVEKTKEYIIESLMR